MVNELFPLEMVTMVYFFLTTVKTILDIVTGERGGFIICKFYLAEELKAKAQRVSPLAVL